MVWTFDRQCILRTLWEYFYKHEIIQPSMKSFNLNTQLAYFYDNKPQTSRRPIIGITTNDEAVYDTVRDPE